MGTNVQITGNLLANPERRPVKIGNDNRSVIDLRVWSDVYKTDGKNPDGSDIYVQDEKKSQAYSISVWNERLGDSIMKLLKVGNRVQIDGPLHIRTWVDDKGVTQVDAHVDINDGYGVTLALTRIDEIKFTPKRDQQSQAA